MPETTWNMAMVRAREAAARLPRRRDESGGIDWDEIEAAVIDTGYTEHPVLGPWLDGESPIVRVGDGLNTMDRSAPPKDPLAYEGTPSHGTRVASVLCGNRPGILEGAAPGLPIIPYRAFNNVVVYSKQARKRAARAIRDAVDANSAEVVSMSFGFPQMSLFGQRHLGEAVDHAYERGIIQVCAGGQIVNTPTYPGKFARTVGVGGVRADRTVWFRYDQSMAKRAIDIWAPGADVPRVDTEYQSDAVQYQGVGYGDGTSYATVHVSAAAAMWLRYHGADLDDAYREPWQRVEAFRKLLAQTSQPVEGDDWPDRDKGILDIDALLAAPLPDAEALDYEDREAKDEVF
jgi:subtilisin family serine protease